MAALSTAPAHAVDAFELGDAGQTQATAQVTSAGSGALANIFGSIGSTGDADLYVINITDPNSFSATTANAGTGDLDTQLFLFTLSGAPVYANDDAPDGTSFLSTLTAGSPLGPLTAGLYLLGIALSGYEPVNVNNQLLFAPYTLSTEIRGPNGSLQPAVLGGFDGSGFGTTGAYDIQLTGAVAAVPEPSTALMLLVGGALCAASLARRRRGAPSPFATPVNA